MGEFALQFEELILSLTVETRLSQMAIEESMVRLKREIEGLKRDPEKCLPVYLEDEERRERLDTLFRGRIEEVSWEEGGRVQGAFGVSTSVPGQEDLGTRFSRDHRGTRLSAYCRFAGGIIVHFRCAHPYPSCERIRGDLL